MESANAANLGLVASVTYGWANAMAHVWVVVGLKVSIVICVSKNPTETEKENVYAIQSGARNNVKLMLVSVLQLAMVAMALPRLTASPVQSIRNGVQLDSAYAVQVGVWLTAQSILETAMSFAAKDATDQLNMTVLAV